LATIDKLKSARSATSCWDNPDVSRSVRSRYAMFFDSPIGRLLQGCAMGVDAERIARI
jgi:hypothetical protein